MWVTPTVSALTTRKSFLNFSVLHNVSQEIAGLHFLDRVANVKHFFTLLGKMFFTSYGKEFFIYHGKQIFTSQGKHLFTRYGKQTLSSAQPCG